MIIKNLKVIHKLIIPPVLAVTLGIFFIILVIYQINIVQKNIQIVNVRYIAALEKSTTNITLFKKISEKFVFAILANERDMLPTPEETEQISSNLNDIRNKIDKDIYIKDTLLNLKQYFNVAMKQAKHMIEYDELEKDKKESQKLTQAYTQVEENLFLIKQTLENMIRSQVQEVETLTDDIIYFIFVFMVVFSLLLLVLSYIIYTDFNTRLSLLVDKLKRFEILYSDENIKSDNIKIDELSFISSQIDEKMNTLKDLRTETKRIEYDAMHDALTGLYNRRYLENFSEDIYRPFSVLMLDIDYFKRINDTYGHDVGDNVLKDFGIVLAHETDMDDLIIRYGGEEFLVITDVSNKELLLRIAERIRESVERFHFPEINHITVSIGCAICLDDATLNETIKQADEALYTAKDGGRNRTVIHE
jgi:diguanylate cyclase (GGDEF)-like protein